MAAAGCALRVTLLVVARLAHEFSAVLLLQMFADKLVLKACNSVALSQVFNRLHLSLSPLEVEKELHLDGADCLFFGGFFWLLSWGRSSSRLWNNMATDLPGLWLDRPVQDQTCCVGYIVQNGT